MTSTRHKRRRNWGAMLIALVITGGVAGPAHAYCQNNRDVAIWSVAQEKYVSAEVSYPGADDGMLRARNGYPGAWETFRMECNGSSGFWLKSRGTGKYVTVEIGYGTGGDGIDRRNMLRARRSTPDIYSTFNLHHPLDHGWMVDGFLYNVTAGKYVSTEVNYPGNFDGMLRARSGSAGAWERYELEWLD